MRKRAAITGTFLLIIFSNNYLCNLCNGAWEMGPVQLPNSAHYSCAIVLGGFTSQLKGKEGRFNSASDRFIEGIRLQSTGKVAHILISGGNGNLNPGGYSEGEWVRGQLKQLNYPDNVILIESKSRNTLENAKFSAELLKRDKLPPPYLLITSGYHMRRALMIFKKQGVDVQPFISDLKIGKTGGFRWSDLIPSFEAIMCWNLTIKEIFGYFVNSLMAN